MTTSSKNCQPIRPPRLNYGDTIGIISPAGVIETSELEPGLDRISKAGFKIYKGHHVYDQKKYLAGKDSDRIKDLHHMIISPEIKALFCARGGYGSMRLLNLLPYDLILKNPKIIVGYSDITALLLAIYSQTGMIGFHGPVVRDLTNKDPDNLTNLIQCLTTNQPVVIDISSCDVMVAGEAQGPLLGGNLSLISHLLGTPYLPSLNGAILFIEDRGETLYRLDRMLTHLCLSGHINDLRGVIMGQFPDCGRMGDIRELFMERLARFEIPLISGFPAGHGLLNISFPVGETAILNTDAMTLKFSEICTK